MNLQHFTRFFEIHQWIFAKHVEGVTHEESCRTLSGGGNSLNWVLGHIVASRNDILKLLGEPPIWSEAEAAPYVRGSTGMRDPATARPLSEINDALERSHVAIRSKLEKMSADDLAKPTEKGTVGADLSFFQFHESYHAGQIGYLRRLLGKEGVIR